MCDVFVICLLTMQGWGQVTPFHFINCYYYWAKTVVNSKWAKLGIFEDFWMNDWPNKHKNGDRQKDKIGKSSSILKKAFNAAVSRQYP